MQSATPPPSIHAQVVANADVDASASEIPPLPFAGRRGSLDQTDWRSLCGRRAERHTPATSTPPARNARGSRNRRR